MLILYSSLSLGLNNWSQTKYRYRLCASLVSYFIINKLIHCLFQYMYFILSIYDIVGLWKHYKLMSNFLEKLLCCLKLIKYYSVYNSFASFSAQIISVSCSTMSSILIVALATRPNRLLFVLLLHFCLSSSFTNIQAHTQTQTHTHTLTHTKKCLCENAPEILSDSIHFTN